MPNPNDYSLDCSPLTASSHVTRTEKCEVLNAVLNLVLADEAELAVAGCHAFQLMGRLAKKDARLEHGQRPLPSKVPVGGDDILPAARRQLENLPDYYLDIYHAETDRLAEQLLAAETATLGGDSTTRRYCPYSDQCDRFSGIIAYANLDFFALQEAEGDLVIFNRHFLEVANTKLRVGEDVEVTRTTDGRLVANPSPAGHD